MTKHNMLTRSKSAQKSDNQRNVVGGRKIKKTKSRAPKKFYLDGFKESKYNYYAGQQILGLRDLSFREYYDEVRRDTPETMRNCLQTLYDGGCAMIELGVVHQCFDGHFELNPYFGDYDAWIYGENIVLDNCEFLKSIRHNLYM